MAMEQFVFVSYSRKDESFVERLVSDLRLAGIQTWRDVESIKPGEEWAHAIRAALSETAAVVYVSSQHTRKSGWMSHEIAAALGRSVPIYPVIIDDAGGENLPPGLRPLQWVDVRKDYRAAIDRLIQTLPRTVFREQSVLPEVQKSKGYVFISYADEDYEFIVQLRNFLKGKGYAFWDFQESERDYHSLAFLELETAIREAVGFLGVISPDWKRSKWTPKELLFSEEVGTPIFLLKVRPTEATLLIAGMSYIDFTRDCDDAFGKLDRQLKRKGL